MHLFAAVHPDLDVVLALGKVDVCNGTVQAKELLEIHPGFLGRLIAEPNPHGIDIIAVTIGIHETLAPLRHLAIHYMVHSIMRIMRIMRILARIERIERIQRIQRIPPHSLFASMMNL